MVGTIDILASASAYDYDSDVKGLASYAYPGDTLDRRIIIVAQWILQNDNMWFEVHNADTFHQSATFRGRRPLYLNDNHTKRNPHLTASDYLFVFKEYMRLWAARKHEGSPEADWEAMLEELSNVIYNEQFLKENYSKGSH